MKFRERNYCVLIRKKTCFNVFNKCFFVVFILYKNLMNFLKMKYVGFFSKDLFKDFLNFVFLSQMKQGKIWFFVIVLGVVE